MIIKTQNGEVINSKFVKTYWWDGKFTCVKLLGEDRSTYLCRDLDLVDEIFDALIKGADYFVCVGGKSNVD
jgi:hypothetical protein